MEVSAGVGVQARIGGDQNLPQHLGQHDEVPVCLVLEVWKIYLFLVSL